MRASFAGQPCMLSARSCGTTESTPSTPCRPLLSPPVCSVTVPFESMYEVRGKYGVNYPPRNYEVCPGASS